MIYAMIISLTIVPLARILLFFGGRVRKTNDVMKFGFRKYPISELHAYQFTCSKFHRIKGGWKAKVEVHYQITYLRIHLLDVRSEKAVDTLLMRIEDMIKN